MPICSKCGDDKKAQGFAMHEANCKGGGVAVMERPSGPPEPRSRRAQERMRDPAPTAFEQIPTLPNGVFGAWAYYLRPTGATISEALVLYPNGGIPDNADARLRGKYGTNAEYYRGRQARNGFKYLGTKLTLDAMRQLMEVLSANREDEILYMQDVIADMDYKISGNADPRWTGTFQRRNATAQKRLEMLTEQWDPEALVKELDDISRAQRMAAVPGNVLQAVKELIGEANEQFNSKIAMMAEKFRQGHVSEDSSLGGAKNVQRTAKADTDFGDGQVFVNV